MQQDREQQKETFDTVLWPLHAGKQVHTVIISAT